MPPRNAVGAESVPVASHSSPAQAGVHYVPDLKPASEPLPHVGMYYKGFLGDNFADRPLLQRLNWLHVPLLVITPLLAVYGLATWTFNARTLAFAVLWYFATGLGITAGYHRLFAHRAYTASDPVRVALLLLGAGAVQGSVRWWSRDHRAHHRYVDTDKDPYAVTKGFWHAHIGWMMVKQDKERIGRADISDLDRDPWIRWQHKYYLPIAVAMAIVVPTVVCGLGWGDWYGGYFIAAVARLVVVHHGTFCVNSMAHYLGDAVYSDGHTARNHWVTALLTIGEGYHNFHHEFPSDYRNGVEWYQYDPTKWIIRGLALLGLVSQLQRFPDNEVAKGKLQMRSKALRAEAEALNWGPDPALLPLVSKDDVARGAAAGKQWLILDGFVLDVSPFAASHPGGASLLRADAGADVSEKFKGAYYKHSNAAKNLAATLRIARVRGYWD